MKIIYISSACKKDDVEKIDKTAKIKLKYSIIKFHNAIMNGLASNNINIESIIGLPVSIKTNKKIFWEKNERKVDNINYTYSGFINLPVIKQITMSININKILKNILKNKNSEEVYIIVDASFVSILPKIYKTAQKYNINIIGIFADVYDYMFDVQKNTNKSDIIKKYLRKKLKNIYSNLDGYIFLTEEMNKLINVNNKNYMVMEGIYEKNDVEEKVFEKSNFIMYAGGLHEKYGIKLLVDAFAQLENKNIELHLYGTGDLTEYVENVSKNNSNIKYYGVVPNEKILEEERKALLVVNPRLSDKDYTKYSFPSKTIEYMSSGTPVLTTKLAGMPKEYYDYVYLIEEESEEGIKNAINSLINNKTKEELKQKGEAAQLFIQKNKNNYAQTKRIIDFIDSLAKERE